MLIQTSKGHAVILPACGVGLIEWERDDAGRVKSVYLEVQGDDGEVDYSNTLEGEYASALVKRIRRESGLEVDP